MSESRHMPQVLNIQTAESSSGKKPLVELSAKVEALIVAFLFLVFGLGLGDSVVTTVQNVNTTGWTFTGYTAVKSMISLFPIIYYAAIILGFLGIIWYAITKTT